MNLRDKPALAELMRRRIVANYSLFVWRCWTLLPSNARPPEWTKVLTLMCVLVEAVFRGRLGVVALNCPPGTGKSTVCTRLAWPWAVLEEPWLSAVTGVHGIDELGVPFQLDRLKLMRTPAYQALIPRIDGLRAWDLDPDMSNRRRIGLAPCVPGVTAGGWSGLASPERGGSGVRTGAHPWVHQYDDLIAAGEELGPARAEANAWVCGPMTTRFPVGHDPRIISLGQRLHESDYTAALLEQYPEALHIVLPMEYDPAADRGVHDLGPASRLMRQAYGGDPTLASFRRRHEAAGIWLDDGQMKWADWRSELGEPLMPRLAPRRKYERHKRSPVLWLTQYQQTPVSGQMSHVQPEHWARWRELPPGEPDELGLVCDPQSGSTAGRVEQDYTTIYPAARYGSRAYVLEEVRARFDFGATARMVFWLYARWGLRSGMIEDSGCGPAVVSHLDGLVTGLHTVRAKGSTEMRVQWVAPMIQAGNVLLPAEDAVRPHLLPAGQSWPVQAFGEDEFRTPPGLSGANGVDYRTRPPAMWVPEFIEEWAAVPRGSFDDRCELAHMLMGWVGVLGRDDATPGYEMTPRGRPSRARAAGFGERVGRGWRR